MLTKTLMIQGTTSDAGKSAIVTGLCRLLKRQGYKVAPFKPQNMALNSAVTSDGGEIGRAQAAQAQACGLEPHTDMNPILLKPSSDIGSQVIINGKVHGQMTAVEYHAFKPQAMQYVLEAHQRLQEKYDIIIVEGAGSPAEINLRENDIANMGFAEAIDCPVWLVADIDRGGVFASLVGTLELLSESERRRTQGLIINRFRGDVALLQSGIDWIESRTQKPVLGVVPYLKDLYLEAEDSLNIVMDRSNSSAANINIIVPRLPKLSNHTDFDVLQHHPQVNFQFVDLNDAIPAADLIILAGSKSVRSDLQALKETSWNKYIQQHLRYGGKLLGICGGYQMLGNAIHDPQGIEGSAGSEQGLGLLELETTLETEKQLLQQQGELSLGGKVVGYEIHVGVTRGNALQKPMIHYKDHQDGAISDDEQIMGCYLHGLFDEAEACNALLKWAGLHTVQTQSHFDRQEQGIDQLADCLEKQLDLRGLLL